LEINVGESLKSTCISFHDYSNYTCQKGVEKW